MPIRVNLSGVGEGGPRVVPPGYYSCVVDKAAVKTSVSSGEPYIEFQLVVVKGEYAGTRLYYNNSLQQQALWKFKESLVAMGFSPEQLNSAEDIEVEESDLVGSTVSALVANKLFDGKMRNDVQELSPDKASASATQEPPF